METFYILGCRVNLANVPKASFISYCRISYFRHACSKLNLVIISRLTGKRATQNLKKTYEILVYGHVGISWTYQ